MQLVATNKLEQIRAVYALVPPANCKGLCQDSCMGPIPATRPERVRVSQVGAQLPFVASTCSNLDKEGHCRVYNDRPLICRLWGVAENMPCPHGCVPDGGMVTREQAGELVARVVSVAGEAY